MRRPLILEGTKRSVITRQDCKLSAQSLRLADVSIVSFHGVFCFVLSSEQLARVSEFSKLGALFRSSPKPAELTESETEYVVNCVKHVFSDHVVFQVRVASFCTPFFTASSTPTPTFSLQKLPDCLPFSSHLFIRFTYTYTHARTSARTRAHSPTHT